MKVTIKNEQLPNLQLDTYNVSTPDGELNVFAMDPDDAKDKALSIIKENAWLGNIDLHQDGDNFSTETFKIVADTREDAEKYLAQYIRMQQQNDKNWENAEIQTIDPINESVIRIRKGDWKT